MTHSPGILLALLLLQADPIADEALRGYRPAWGDFADGSTVTYRETLRRPDIGSSQNLVYKDVTSEVTWTLISPIGDKPSLKLEGNGEESVIPYYPALPGWARGKGERRGTEEVAVGGVKRTCRVTTLTLDPDKDASQVTLISKCAEVPYWAVRRRVETLIKGQANTVEEEVVLDVDQNVKVGDRDLRCILVQVTVEAVGGPRTVRKEWRSDEVPGRLVRRETRQYLRGQELESGYSQMEVVRFRAKR